MKRIFNTFLALALIAFALPQANAQLGRYSDAPRYNPGNVRITGGTISGVAVSTASINGITGLVLGNGASAATAYAGSSPTTCTNQFARSMSINASGVVTWTCATIASADVGTVLASPPAIGGSTPAAITGTTVAATTLTAATHSYNGDMAVGPTGLNVLNLQTNNTTRWQVTLGGALIAGADNGYDIGASGSNRPRTAYIGTSVVTPTLFVTTSASPASGAACTAGAFTWDASFTYVCTATGAWKRAALTGGY